MHLLSEERKEAKEGGTEGRKKSVTLPWLNKTHFQSNLGLWSAKLLPLC